MPHNESNLAAGRAAPAHGARLAACRPPSWVTDWLSGDGAANQIDTECADDWSIEVRRDLAYVEVRCRDAGSLPPAQFASAVESGYGRIASLLRRHEAAQPVRFWNYVPRIHEDAVGCGDRYMVFNAGRHRAFESWYHSAAFQPRLIAASAVDHRGDDLIIQTLACRGIARPIDNPRQRPAYRYSRRYGAVPPSFARATLIDRGKAPGLRTLLTAGTASVVGEDSRHIDNLPRQLDEVEINLAMLIAASTPSKAQAARIENDAEHRRDHLTAYRHLRAYVVRAEDEPAVARWMRRAFAGVERVEIVPADLCRRGLVVEVEGVALIPARDDDAPAFAEPA